MVRYWTVTHTAIAKPNGWFFKGTGGFRDNWIRVFHRGGHHRHRTGFFKGTDAVVFIGACGASAGLYFIWIMVAYISSYCKETRLPPGRK